MAAAAAQRLAACVILWAHAHFAAAQFPGFSFRVLRFASLHAVARMYDHPDAPPPAVVPRADLAPDAPSDFFWFADTRNCSRLRYDPSFHRLEIDGTALRLVAIDPANTAEATEIQLDDVTARDPALVHVCCTGCDRAEVRHVADPATGDRTVQAWCANAVLGRRPVCACDRPEPCPIGFFRTGCTPATAGVCAPCTNGNPRDAVVYLSSGSADRNDCRWRCTDDHFYNRHPQDGLPPRCEPCSQCAPGEFESSPCLQDASFRTYRNTDRVCVPCPFGHTSTGAPGGGADACTKCPIGTVASPSGLGCTQCLPAQYTLTEAAGVCFDCPLGHTADTSRSACTACAPGHHRNESMPACRECAAGTFQPSEGASACAACIGAVAVSPGATACEACAPGSYPSPALATAQAGSSECLPCDTRRAPRDPESFVYESDCTWKCHPGAYREAVRIACTPCAATPCTGTGMVRPPCTGSERRLPPCRRCVFPAGDPMATRIIGVHYRFSAANSCAFHCLPGFDRQNHCRPCRGGEPAPANTVYTGEHCSIGCPRGLTLAAGGESCEPCAKHAHHPRTLGEVAALGSFVAPGEYIDFAACGDARAKVYGVKRVEPAPTPWPHCGNGVLEPAHEECDDGNADAGDGCSETCRLEGGYLSCWHVGSPCEPLCGFGDGVGTPGRPGLFAHYLTDPFCLAGPPRTPALRAECGAACPGRRRPLAECESDNRGCLDCAEGYFVDTLTRACRACGTRCAPGLYGRSDCAPVPPDLDYDAVELSPAQTGCYPCVYAHAPLPSGAAVTFIGPSAHPGDPFACPYTCPTPATYCSPPAFDSATGACAGACMPCTAPTELQCPAGTRAGACNATRDAACEPCAAALLPAHAHWTAAGAGQQACTFACDAGFVFLPERHRCDQCEANKRCTDPRYAPQPCDPDHTAADTPKYCARCPDPPSDAEWAYGMEAVASEAGACGFACTLHRFYMHGDSCRPCKPASTCLATERYVPCSRDRDARCVPCSAPATVAARNQEFYIPYGAVPSCAVRCLPGHAVHPTTGQCVACALLCAGQPGLRSEHDCTHPHERLALPQCVACDDTQSQKPPENAHYTALCTWACDPGFYVARVHTEAPHCAACIPCAVGEYNLSASCSTAAPQLPCASCAGRVPEHARATSSTDPACPWGCELGYARRGSFSSSDAYCTPVWTMRARHELAHEQPAQRAEPVKSTPPPASGGDAASAAPQNSSTRFPGMPTRAAFLEERNAAARAGETSSAVALPRARAALHVGLAVLCHLVFETKRA